MSNLAIYCMRCTSKLKMKSKDIVQLFRYTKGYLCLRPYDVAKKKCRKVHLPSLRFLNCPSSSVEFILLFPRSRSPQAPSSSSLVACIAAVAGCGGRGDNFHHFFNPAQIDGVVPGKCGFERPQMRMKPTALEQSWGYTTQMLHVQKIYLHLPQKWHSFVGKSSIHGAYGLEIVSEKLSLGASSPRRLGDSLLKDLTTSNSQLAGGFKPPDKYESQLG